MASTDRDLSSALNSLRVNTESKTKNGGISKKREIVADSWEDEATEGSKDHDNTSTGSSGPASPIGLSRQSTNFDPHPPPPTPSSPTPHGFSYSDLESSERFAHLSKTTSTSSSTTTPPPSSHSAVPQRAVSARSPSDAPARRPDKTTATATRLIAAGLGLKAPKRTEAEREYDKVTRDAARQQREKQREEAQRQQEETERAKAAVWED